MPRLCGVTLTGQMCRCAEARQIERGYADVQRLGKYAEGMQVCRGWVVVQKPGRFAEAG